MNREFFINITVLIIINLLVKPFYIFGIEMTIQDSVSNTEYGMFFTLLNFTWIFQIINDLGLQNYNNRTISQSPRLLPEYLFNILAVKGVLGTFYFAIVFVGAWMMGYEAKWYLLLGILALNWVLNALLLYLRTNISGLGLYRMDSFLSVLDKLLVIVVCGYLLWVSPGREHFQILWLALSQTFAYLTTSVVALVILSRRLQYLPKRINTGRIRLLLTNSMPYAIVIALMTAYTRIDGVMIERLLPDGDAEAGIYASAYRLLDAANMFGYLFGSLLLPMFSKLLKQEKAVNSLVRLSFGLIFGGAVAVAVAIWFHQADIMTFLYTKGTAYSGQILGYLMVSFVAVTASYVYGTLLVAKGRVGNLNYIFLLGVLLNLLLNWWLIPQHKALGAAIATCITQFFVFFGQVYIAYREVDLKRDLALFVKAILFSLSSVVVTYGLVELDLNWMLSATLSLCCNLLLAIPFGFISLRLVKILNE